METVLLNLCLTVILLVAASTVLHRNYVYTLTVSILFVRFRLVLMKMAWLQSLLDKTFPFDLAKASTKEAVELREEVVVPPVWDPLLVSRLDQLSNKVCRGVGKKKVPSL